MRAINTNELAEAVGVGRWVIDQMLARRILKDVAAYEPGRPRAWDFGEAMRVAVIVRVSAWVPLFAGRRTKPEAPTPANRRGKDERTPAERILDVLAETPLHGFRGDGSFLIVRAVELPDGNRAFNAEVVRASALAKAAQRPLSTAEQRLGATHRASLLIDLGAIESELLEAWPAE